MRCPTFSPFLLCSTEKQGEAIAKLEKESTILARPHTLENIETKVTPPLIACPIFLTHQTMSDFISTPLLAIGAPHSTMLPIVLLTLFIFNSAAFVLQNATMEKLLDLTFPDPRETSLSPMQHRFQVVDKILHVLEEDGTYMNGTEVHELFERVVGHLEDKSLVRRDLMTGFTKFVDCVGITVPDSLAVSVALRWVAGQIARRAFGVVLLLGCAGAHLGPEAVDIIKEALD
jgi:hypothetical protein